MEERVDVCVCVVAVVTITVLLAGHSFHEHFVVLWRLLNGTKHRCRRKRKEDLFSSPQTTTPRQKQLSSRERSLFRNWWWWWDVVVTVVACYHRPNRNGGKGTGIGTNSRSTAGSRRSIVSTPRPGARLDMGGRNRNRIIGNLEARGTNHTIWFTTTTATAGSNFCFHYRNSDLLGPELVRGLCAGPRFVPVGQGQHSNERGHAILSRSAIVPSLQSRISIQDDAGRKI